MKKRRLAAGIMAAAMVVGTLAGCGGGSSSGGSSGSGDSTTAAAETTTAAAVQAEVKEATGEDVTIKVALWDYSNTEYYKTMISAFEEKYPNVKVEVVEFTADEYDNVIVTQLSGKQDFDVVFTKSTPALSALINQGHIYALDDLIASDSSFDPANYSGLVEALALDGNTYALPFRYDNNLIFYNKDLFDAAGVAYPEDGMTIQEYHELATKMTSGEGNDKVYGAHAHTWASNVSIYANREEKFNLFDVGSYDNLIPYYNEFLAMQDEGVIQDYGALKSSNIHYSGVFYNQQAAMLQIGTWFINMLCENAEGENGFRWGVCSLPSNEGIGNENCIGGVTPVSIGAYAKHPAEAWQFLTFVCGEEGAKTLASCGIIPGYSSDAIKAIFDALPQTYVNAPEGLSKYVSCEKNLLETPLNPKGKEADTINTEQHSAIMTKSVTVEEGIQQFKDRVSEVLAQ